MAGNLRANIELGVQIVIAIAVVVVAGVVVKRYLFPRPAERGSLQQQVQSIVGTQMNVPGVNWEQNKKSLVFFLKRDCPFCKVAAPFYRELIEDASKKNVKSLAILPEPLAEGTEYVKSLNLPIDNVQTGSLESHKILGTPTVVFVDSQGTVQGVWVGAQSGRENDMRSALNKLY